MPCRCAAQHVIDLEPTWTGQMQESLVLLTSVQTGEWRPELGHVPCPAQSLDAFSM